MTSYAKDLQFVIELAREAARLVHQRAGHVDRLTKTHATTSGEAVTEADRASQRLIVAGLRKRFAGDGILGEENDTGSGITFDCPDPTNPPDRVWVIDPIDGTNNFVAGLETYAVCIGLLERGVPVLGVVYDVERDLPYAAARGEGAWLGDRRLHAASTPLGDASLLMMTSNLLNQDKQLLPFVGRWLGQTNWKIRMLGSAAIEGVQVAAGIAHASITLNGKLWDIAASSAIILEAGGIVSHPDGADIFPFDLRRYAGEKVPFLAAAPAARAQLLREIAS